VPLENGTGRRGKDDEALLARNARPRIITPRNCRACPATWICLLRTGTGSQHPRWGLLRLATLRGSTWESPCASGLRTKGLFVRINQLIGPAFSMNRWRFWIPAFARRCAPSASGPPFARLPLPQIEPAKRSPSGPGSIAPGEASTVDLSREQSQNALCKAEGR